MGKKDTADPKILSKIVKDTSGNYLEKYSLTEMLVGGVIMDVTSVEQAKIAEQAGAQAVMALERVPYDIRREGGVARMTAIEKIKAIKEAVTIPVMAKCRIGHYAEAQILEKLEIDFIDESEVLTSVYKHIDKREFKIPFVCGCRDLGEALRRIEEGAVMIRTKGEAGTGDVKEAIEHIEKINGEIAYLHGCYGLSYENKLREKAREYQVSDELVELAGKLGRLPVRNLAAGGIATPADAMYCMELGVDGIFVGSGIFKSTNPEARAKAIVIATCNYDKPEEVVKSLEKIGDLGGEMKGISTLTLEKKEMMQYR